MPVLSEGVQSSILGVTVYFNFAGHRLGEHGYGDAIYIIGSSDILEYLKQEDLHNFGIGLYEANITGELSEIYTHQKDIRKRVFTYYAEKYAAYLKLRKSTWNEYETRLNWDVWGEKVNRILEETVLNFKKKDTL